MRAWLLMAVILTGCTTLSYRGMDESTQSWIGKTEDDLVLALGAPTKVYQTPGGVRVLEYTDVYEEGTKYAPMGFGVTEAKSYSEYCRTKYVIKNSVIHNASWEGNSCPKTREGKPLLSNIGL